MNEYEYKGYIISFDNDNYRIGDFEFPTLTEAMRWVDDMVDDDDKDTSKSQNHTYLFFYIDRTTDQAFEARVVAKDLQEAKNILRSNYDVYSIADYDILD